MCLAPNWRTEMAIFVVMQMLSLRKNQTVCSTSYFVDLPERFKPGVQNLRAILRIIWQYIARIMR